MRTWLAGFHVEKVVRGRHSVLAMGVAVVTDINFINEGKGWREVGGGGGGSRFRYWGGGPLCP